MLTETQLSNYLKDGKKVVSSTKMKRLQTMLNVLLERQGQEVPKRVLMRVVGIDDRTLYRYASDLKHVEVRCGRLKMVA